MSSRVGLLTDLRRIRSEIARDLTTRAPSDPATDRMREEYRAARAQMLTASTWQARLEEQLSQIATGWVLATVLVRFCEDNGLLDLSFATRRADEPDAEPSAEPGADDPISSAVNRLSSHPAMAAVFSRSSHPMWRMRPSHEARRALVDFWRLRTPDGLLVHDFEDASRDTRFLADLYGHLSDQDRKSSGQVSTPDFVVELIHDLTLEPALEAHGSTAGPAGFRMIDPACGTGGFLLDAYARLCRRWSDARPEMSPWQRAARALASVHGCDIDPCAVSISRFRLLMAAMDVARARRLDDVPDIPLLVATGDALLHDRAGASLGPEFTDFPTGPGLTGSGSPADIDEYAERHSLLRPSSYHAVTSNPPYVTVKDKALFAAYRDTYESCEGPYALSVPFTELAFRLALPGASAGRIGLLVANSFMKRDFGRKLIERVLPRVMLSHVIDTSGAYIPGHGTPTVILVGQNRVPPPEVPVHVVVSLRGETRGGELLPAVPADAPAWQSLCRLAFAPGVMGHWAESYLLKRAQLNVFPWSLTPSAARHVLRLMENGKRLRERVARIGYAANTGSDDLFCSTPAAFRRYGVEDAATVPVLTGSEVRDWSSDAPGRAFFPRTGNGREVIDLDLFPRHRRRLWPYRTVLRQRRGANKSSPWYDWHQFALDWDAHPWSIVFPWVATHPHFTVLRGGAVPLNSAPVIKLPPNATESSHLGLLGVLNSSAACFWLKQVSQSKGQAHIGTLRGGEAWEKIYEFTAGRLLDLPLPGTLPPATAEEIDALATESAVCLSEISAPDAPLTARTLDSARERWFSLRARMIGLQEELDWQVYAAYGIVDDTEELTAVVEPPPLQVGERAFEITLARRIAVGETGTSWFTDDPEGKWFTRHQATPVTEIPEQWPSEYRNLVQRRAEAISRNAFLALLERPEYKHRWIAPDWDAIVQDILRERLLDHCEAERLWFETTPNGRRPVARTVWELSDLLAEDEEFMSLLSLYADPAHAVGTGIPRVLLDLLTTEHVPQAAPLRYRPSGLAKRRTWEELWQAQAREDERGPVDARDLPEPPRFTTVDFLKSSYWKQRGKFDLPNERLVSFGSSIAPLSSTTLLGWAGWDARERAQVLLDTLETESHAHAHRPESALPLLSALAEVLPWVTAVDRGLGPVTASDGDERYRRSYEHHLDRLGLSAEDVTSWRPAAPRRGRPRKGV
ncbi:BREX-2 system adenine-specific DNA-methyltransferase PglX [Streptomyces sp. VNUA24]|uniref:BREX-2 system adenine-specific DNA-methyltransferase PglX n=1 Tax=Streptomyces sp. VNUA24 TaxID=3031131 RepID=UPI0023B85D32|nr:BREX-2 system adenine-specific DNA-methyltransferase PglX [Streptomyces sp. VNUA24]WEH17282.1 BREX-2 system adenine-specific DNA-methyltransferase PglX [Streptomyces sp. VNUA24]